MRRSILVLFFSLFCLQGCAGVVAALPTITAIGAQVLSLLQGIDTAVQENFRQYPDTPADVRQEYAYLSDKVLRAYRSLLRAAEGGKELSDANVQEALKKFYEAYNEYRGWLFKQKMMDRQGRLLVAGKAIGEVPTSAELHISP